MRLCTIMSGGKPAVGVKTGNGKIVDLSKQMPRGPKSVVEILAGGKKVQALVAKACAKGGRPEALLRMRSELALARGDTVGARKAIAKAIKLAPLDSSLVIFQKTLERAS